VQVSHRRSHDDGSIEVSLPEPADHVRHQPRNLIARGRLIEDAAALAGDANRSGAPPPRPLSRWKWHASK
jgi:hypothetical protein